MTKAVLMIIGLTLIFIMPFTLAGQENEDSELRPLKIVLAELEKAYDVKFSYMEEAIQDILVGRFNRPEKIESILIELLSGTDVSYKIIDAKNIILIKSKKKQKQKEQTTSSQNGSISGFVRDASSKECLIGANVFLLGTNWGDATNLQGFFSLLQIPEGRYILACHYMGYKPYKIPIEIKAGQKKSVTIAMEPDEITGEEIVIIADSVRSTIERMFTRPLSKIEIKPIEIKNLPQVAETDILRSFQSMPGITAVSDFSSALYIRGGTSDQNLYQIDGADVYNPEHAFGLFSTFNTDAIKNVELSKGGFGAEYGGRLSSVMNITNMEGNREKFEGTASLSLLSGKTNLQFPVKNYGAVSVSLRRTYFDQTVGRAIKDIPNYYFYDGSVKGFFQIDDKNYLTVSMFKGRDVFDLTSNTHTNDDGDIDLNWGNTNGSIRWTRVFNPQWFANFWVTGSLYDCNFNFDRIQRFAQNNRITDWSLKGNITYKQSQYLTYKVGFEQKNLNVSWKVNDEPSALFVNYKNPAYLIVTYFQTDWEPNKQWFIETGFRTNYFNSQKKIILVEPRGSIKYRLTESSNIKAAGGLFYQFLHRIPMDMYGVWMTSNDYYKPSSALHAILGYQYQWQDIYELEVETYYKKYYNIYAYNPNFTITMRPTSYDPVGNSVYNNLDGMLNIGDGYSAGLEIMLKKIAGPLTGWTGLTLSRTLNRFDGVNQNKSFTPRHDRTVMVNTTCNADVRNTMRWLKNKPLQQEKSKWILGINFVYSTGQPITLVGSSYWIRSSPDAHQLIYKYPSTINKFRLPYYARLDLSVTYQRQYTRWLMEYYLQIFNVGFRQNVWYVEYKTFNREGQIFQTVKPVPMFPIVPTFGVNCKF